MRTRLDACLRAVNEVLLGKEAQVRLAMACLLARGHLLVEDMPGMGKTTLSHAPPRCWARLPAHPVHVRPAAWRHSRHLGIRQGQRAVRLPPGPIFAELVLADEINRATPKARARCSKPWRRAGHHRRGDTPLARAVLRHRHAEPGELWRHLRVAGVAAGPLSYARLLGLPAKAAEKSLLLGESRRDLLTRLEPLLQHDELRAIRDAVGHVRVSDALVDYVLRLVEATRTQPQFAGAVAARQPGVAGGCRARIPRRTRLRDSGGCAGRVAHRGRPPSARARGCHRSRGGALVHWLLREVPAL